MNEDKNKQEIIESIKRKNIPVIIFGAATVGEALFFVCKDSGIDVICFCDNNINKTNKTFCGTKVIHSSELKSKYKEAIFLISAADIKDVLDQLKGIGYFELYAGGMLLKDFDIYKHKFSVPIDFVEYTVSTTILCHDNYLMQDKLFLRSIDLVITERCSLKCRGCSNLMQYYKKPVNYDLKEIFQDIERLFSIVDEVNEFRVIGGEPFMNKESHLVIKKLIDEPKVKKIVIYTNGTIMPKDEQIEYLKNNKVLIIITDYGKLSRNLEKLTQFLQQNKIAFFAEKAKNWTDCAKINKNNRDIREQKKIFDSCCAKNLVTLLKGKLYRCPFSANATRLKAIPNFKKDYIDIFNNDLGKIDFKNKIRDFLLKKEYLECCDYCNGRSFGDLEIEPAVQIDKPLEYEIYE